MKKKKKILNFWPLAKTSSARSGVSGQHFIFLCQMPVLHYSRLSVPHPSSGNVPSTLLWPCTMKEYKYCLQNTFQASFYDPALKKVSPSSMYLNSSRLQHIGALHMRVDIGNRSNFCHFHESKLCIGSSEMATCDEEARVDVFSEYIDGFWDMDQTEKERRRKIGLANKGRVPWNKETCARIKQRTREALRNPKVRKKMGEHPIAHSDESKARISSALKHVWGKRLRWKQLGEKFLLTWSESIAKAAKDGGNDQQELDWDSYDKIKQEMALQRLQWAVGRAKAKEMAKKQAALARAEKAALKEAEKIAKLAEKKKEREDKAKTRREMKRKAGRRSEKGVSPGLKLMKRLIKIHKKKSVAGPVIIPENIGDLHIRAWEKLDIGLVKKEKMQSETSLADQIRAAKEKRMESVTREVLQPRPLVIHQV
ncbi:Histone-lysine N-methyltransferase H3 lysine-79 specific-like protein [Citrus sinensis]|uniref:uncharacterized protein LOC102615933 isoform X2 n=1 Tax=Citrus sinensis TaxID=2711 RepID=UPI00218CC2C1|nr:uncharacterized protein LOC102615933 isoform X2 [Citrus sinensis]KAH9763788.1 Histone-lysine N-methyltransferase H3 lysine-79 specific-like protein [Citrus sinensis]